MSTSISRRSRTCNNMGHFKEVIKELKGTLRMILLFDTFIESFLVFLCIYVFCIIFNLPYTFALFPSVIYFFVMIFKRRNLTSIKAVENKYPILNEALRTANDTIGQDNYLVNYLRDQVRDKVKKVSASTFMDLKGDMLKIVLSVGLIFLVMGLTICKGTSDTCRQVFEKTDIVNAVQTLDINEIYSQLRQENVKAYDIKGVPVDTEYNVDAKDILLDDSTIANLGDDKIRIRIKLASDQIDINDVSDSVTKKEFLDMDLTDIKASGDVSFKESIPKEHLLQERGW
jgi:hypothetical protein